MGYAIFLILGVTVMKYFLVVKLFMRAFTQLFTILKEA